LRRTFVLLVLAAASLAPAAAAEGPQTPAPYTLGATVRCVRATGATVGKVPRVGTDRSQLRDLAQRTSFEVRAKGRFVDVALAPSPSGAQLLLELLDVPQNKYEVSARGNAVLLYARAGKALAARVTRCLRG
jgi:hypothetical protein